MVVCNSGICMHIGSVYSTCPIGWSGYVVACVGLLPASLLKLFDVVCRLYAGDVTMTDE